jgi:putative ABC transport system permease protein
MLKQILRPLLRQWGFSASVIAIVALGVGVNAAVFAVAYSLLLRDLPFHAANDLVVVKEASKSFDTGLVSPTAYLEWRDRNLSLPFAAMTAFMWWEGSGEDPILAVSILPNYFDVMGVKPLLGRTFTEEDNRAGVGSATILSYGFWQRKYGGDPGVVGRRIKAGEWNPMIVGVMPPAPTNLKIGWGDMWSPIRLRQQYNRSETTSARYLRVVARLRPGIDRDRALAAMTVIERQLQAERPEIFAGYEVRIEALRDALAGEFKPALTILLGAAGCLLLLACASLANMLVAHSAAHEKEVAVRVALGATRSSLTGRLLAGNLILAGIGAALGFALCRTATAWIAYFEPGIRIVDVDAYSWPVAGLCAGLALLTAWLVTAPLAFGLDRRNVHESLKEGGRGGTAGVHRQRMRGLLVSAEVALALSLLVVSALLARSFIGLMATDLGFQPENVLLLESNIGDSYYNTAARRLGYYRPLLRTLSALPGVGAVGGLRYFPMHARLWTTAIQVKENPVPAAQRPIVYYNRVAGDYFEAMGIPLVAGRLPTAEEMWEGSDHVLVNSVAARILFPHGQAVGKHIMDDGGGKGQEVIGVVGSVHQAGLGSPPRPEVYYLMGEDVSTGILTIAIRTRQTPDANLTASIAKAVQHYDPAQTRPAVTPLSSFLGDTISARRAAARLGSVFAVLSLLLAALGIHGLVSYWVTQRTGEFGIRMALGASASSLIRLVVGHSLRLAGVGIVVGLALSFLLARVIASLFYGMPEFDVVAFVGAPVVLGLVAVLAASRPALRATRINAMEALRSE